MKKLIYQIGFSLNYFALVFVISLFSTGCSNDNSAVSPADPFEGGKLHQSPSGTFYIAELHGTFKQMGRQYGLLLKTQLAQFYKEAVEDFMIKEKGINYEDILAQGHLNYNLYPAIFRNFLDGSAETNGLGKDKTYIMSNIFLDIYETGCSSLSAWGDYSTDKKTVAGRNLDLYSSNIRRFGKYFHIVVWNPTGYPASVANIDYIGSIFYQTAMNNKGIFLELQNGQASDTALRMDRENSNNILLESLFRNVSANEVDAWFNTTLSQAGLIMHCSYPDYTTIYEWSTFRVVPRNSNGLISASNDYIDPSWKNYPVFLYDSLTERDSYTYTRRTNLLRQGEKFKGQINPQKMMEIFDTTIPDGGATYPDDGECKTIYSVVAQPAQLKIWLKVRTYSGWEEIDLKKYFSVN